MLQLKPVFIRTKNVRNFEDLMSGLDRAVGEGRLACVYSQAGRGKTRTAQWWHANNGHSVYLRIFTIWHSSERAFLAALAHELGAPHIPGRKDLIFQIIADRLIANPGAVFLDEIEKLPPRFLEIVRDLTDITGAPFVLIGEEELFGLLNHPQRRRVWSRTLEAMRFEPLSPADIVIYAKESAGARLPEDAALTLHEASNGDFRVMKRDLGAMLRIANSKKTTELDAGMARAAIRIGARGAQ
jgi:hypothetical protein